MAWVWLPWIQLWLSPPLLHQSGGFAECWRRATAGYFSCPVSAPAAQCPPLPSAYNPGAGSPVEEVPRAIWSPIDSGEESRNQPFVHLCRSVSSHRGLAGRKGGREDKKADLSPLSGPLVVLGASSASVCHSGLWAHGRQNLNLTVPCAQGSGSGMWLMELNVYQIEM